MKKDSNKACSSIGTIIQANGAVGADGLERHDAGFTANTNDVSNKENVSTRKTNVVAPPQISVSIASLKDSQTEDASKVAHRSPSKQVHDTFPPRGQDLQEPNPRASIISGTLSYPLSRKVDTTTAPWPISFSFNEAKKRGGNHENKDSQLGEAPTTAASQGKEMSLLHQRPLITPSPGFPLFDCHKKHSNSASKKERTNFYFRSPSARTTKSPLSCGSSGSSFSSRSFPRTSTTLANIQIDNEKDGKNVNLRIVTGEGSVTFPVILDSMITEGTQRKSGAIYWTHNGEAFVVDHTKADELGSLLLKYFSHANYGSLQRQLNIYGFKKPLSGIYRGVFHHPVFHRDKNKFEDLAPIKRNTPKKSPARTRSPATKGTSSSTVATVSYNDNAKCRAANHNATAAAPKRKTATKRSRSRNRTPPPNVGSIVPRSVLKPKSTRPIRVSLNNVNTKDSKNARPAPIKNHSAAKNSPLSTPVRKEHRTESSTLASLPTDLHERDLQDVALSMYNHDSVDHLHWALFDTSGANSMSGNIIANAPKQMASPSSAMHSKTYGSTTHQYSQFLCKRNDENYQQQHSQLSGCSDAIFHPYVTQKPPFYHPNWPFTLRPPPQRHPGATLNRDSSRPSAEDFARVLDEIKNLSNPGVPAANYSANCQEMSAFLEHEHKMIEERTRVDTVSPGCAVKMTLFGEEGNAKSQAELTMTMVSPIDPLASNKTREQFSNEMHWKAILNPLSPMDPRGRPSKMNVDPSPMETTVVRERAEKLDSMPNPNLHAHKYAAAVPIFHTHASVAPNPTSPHNHCNFAPSTFPRPLPPSFAAHQTYSVTEPITAHRPSSTTKKQAGTGSREGDFGALVAFAANN